eukprot:TRINITY_DN8226_c0_g1_i1.p1 TRINITY_DN8226_c0_g1~~TRINITY_DN8226_c0_g1_i1.p1  ORF type:complete len:160 (+),score=15.83 TRINITY_DN8226_c0_g1_i1:81-560(+)
MVCAKAQMAAVSSNISYTSVGSAAEVRRELVCQFARVRSEHPSVSYSCAVSLVKKIHWKGRQRSFRVRTPVNYTWKVFAAGPHNLNTTLGGEPRWERVQLLERELEVAISEENYADAMRLRDQLADLRTHITAKDKLAVSAAEHRTLKKRNAGSETRIH